MCMRLMSRTCVSMVSVASQLLLSVMVGWLAS